MLVNLFPESGMYGVEWNLLQLVESSLEEIGVENYRRLIAMCPNSQWRETMSVRLDNWLKKLGAK